MQFHAARNQAMQFCAARNQTNQWRHRNETVTTTTLIFTSDGNEWPQHCPLLSEEVYWLQYNIAMQKQNTAKVYSQLGCRKNPKVI